MRFDVTTLLACALAGAFLTGCDGRPPEPPASGPADPVEALNRLDPRRPVPLLPAMAWHQKQSMQQHLVAVEAITHALSHEDWDGVAAAARTIGTSPDMQRTCRRMGAGAEGFTDLALEFHQRADAVAEAATTRDAAAVLRATSVMLRTCTACHATYRQDVVDAATWSARTGMTPPGH